MGMIFGLLIFLGLALVAVWLWYSLIRIEIFYQRLGDDDQGEIKIFALGGLLRFRLELPKIDWKGIEQGIQMEQNWKSGTSEARLLKQKKKNITLRTIKKMMKNFQRLLDEFSNLKQTIRWFLRHVTWERFEWKTHLGTGDAAEAGILAGVAWTIKTTLVGWISRYPQWEQPPHLVIEPDFYRPRLETRFHGIIRFRIGHAILGIKRLRKKDKGRERKWQSIPFKA